MQQQIIVISTNKQSTTSIILMSINTLGKVINIQIRNSFFDDNTDEVIQRQYRTNKNKSSASTSMGLPSQEKDRKI